MRGHMLKLSAAVMGSLALGVLVVGVAYTQTAKAGQANSRAVTQMSHEATRIFSDVQKAENALSSGNKGAAQGDIQMAMQTRDRLAMTARSNNMAKVVPIYSEIEQASVLGPVMAAKNNGKPVPPAKEPITVDSVNDQFTFVGIDLDKTKARLQAAHEAIQNNNLQAAKDTLNAIGEDLVVAKISDDRPLLAIRENLGIAQAAVVNHKEHEATAALQQASTALAAYAQHSSAHQQDARTLNMKVNEMLKSSGQMNAGASARIGEWWGQVNSWMQTPAA